MPTIPDGKPFPYQSKHNDDLHHATLEVTGSLRVDLGIGHDNFDVCVSFATDAGGAAADVGRVRASKNTDGSFDIVVEDLVLTEGTPNTIDWAVSSTLVNVTFIAIASDGAS